MPDVLTSAPAAVDDVDLIGAGVTFSPLHCSDLLPCSELLLCSEEGLEAADTSTLTLEPA